MPELPDYLRDAIQRGQAFHEGRPQGMGRSGSTIWVKLSGEKTPVRAQCIGDVNTGKVPVVRDPVSGKAWAIGSDAVVVNRQEIEDAKFRPNKKIVQSPREPGRLFVLYVATNESGQQVVKMGGHQSAPVTVKTIPAGYTVLSGGLRSTGRNTWIAGLYYWKFGENAYFEVIQNGTQLFLQTETTEQITALNQDGSTVPPTPFFPNPRFAFHTGRAGVNVSRIVDGEETADPTYRPGQKARYFYENTRLTFDVLIGDDSSTTSTSGLVTELTTNTQIPRRALLSPSIQFTTSENYSEEHTLNSATTTNRTVQTSETLYYSLYADDNLERLIGLKVVQSQNLIFPNTNTRICDVTLLYKNEGVMNELNIGKTTVTQALLGDDVSVEYYIDELNGLAQPYVPTSTVFYNPLFFFLQDPWICLLNDRFIMINTNISYGQDQELEFDAVQWPTMATLPKERVQVYAIPDFITPLSYSYQP